MVEKKKLLIIGPPGVGKTTVTKVFFEMVNPFTLIKSSITPTRGINSKVFTLHDFELGVFDLAGQENKNWFSHERDVFLNSNLILCVFDINMYIKEIQDFFTKIIELYKDKDMRLKECSIVVFLHKVDLVEYILVHHKIKAFKEFIGTELSIKEKISVYPTSIAQNFFLDTFDYITEIVSDVLSFRRIIKQKSTIEELRKDIEIIIGYELGKSYHFNVLFYDHNLQHKDSLIHLNRLKKLGFVEILFDKNRFFLTEKASFFKSGLDRNEMNREQNKINKILDALYLFSNLKEK